jgi:hypothetical protein
LSGNLYRKDLCLKKEVMPKEELNSYFADSKIQLTG